MWRGGTKVVTGLSLESCSEGDVGLISPVEWTIFNKYLLSFCNVSQRDEDYVFTAWELYDTCVN